MSRPARWKATVDAARAEACLAVRLYNDPSEPRSFEAFIVHMHLAWLYLLHATFQRDGIDYRYRQKDNPRRLEKVDGEPKAWELSKCANERWPEQNPVRANIEFFIALRNKIEHRYTKFQQELSVAVGGRSQAFLLNFEEELTAQFGTEASLATMLRFPMFIGSFTADGQSALRQLQSKLPLPLQKFITKSTADLPDEIVHDTKYDMRLRVYLELANSQKESLPIRFIREADMTDEEKKLIKGTGVVIVREQQRDVTSFGWMKPHQVVSAVSERIPFVYKMNHFVQGWRKESIRPCKGSDHPERTIEKYCRYDEPHRDYTYSQAYVEHLVRQLETAEGFQKMTGQSPQSKPQQQAKAS